MREANHREEAVRGRTVHFRETRDDLTVAKTFCVLERSGAGL